MGDKKNSSPNEQEDVLKISLDGTTSLQVRRVMNTSLENGEEVETILEEKIYPLKEITEEELFQLRLSEKPGFVLKANGSFYYTEIPKKLKFLSHNLFEKHLCRYGRNSCQHLSAAEDCNGGCAKVRDTCFDILCKNNRHVSKRKLLKLSKRIEKYDFISLGFETFNTSLESFVVAACTNYQEDDPFPSIPASKANALKKSLADFFYLPD